MGVFIESADVTGLVMNDVFPTGIDAVSETSSAGSLIIYERNKSFFNIDLVGGSDYGWLSLTVMNEIQSMSETMGAVYVLDYEGALYNVRFRNEDLPVISGEKTINRSNQEVSDFYNNIIIKLMGV